MQDRVLCGLLGTVGISQQSVGGHRLIVAQRFLRMLPMPSLLVIAFVACPLASSADAGLQVTDTTTYDQLDSVNQAIAESEAEVAAGARVSSFNGNLMVSHAGSISLPQEGNLP